MQCSSSLQSQKGNIWLLVKQMHCLLALYGRPVPAHTKHCIAFMQCFRRWSNIVEMLYKCFVFAGTAGLVFSYKLRYIAGFSLVEIAISTNQKPVIYLFTLLCGKGNNLSNFVMIFKKNYIKINEMALENGVLNQAFIVSPHIYLVTYYQDF